MKIFVCIKQVPDTETKIQISGDTPGLDSAKWIMNPYDEFAVEEALKLKAAKGGDSKVTVITLGPKKRATDALRTALAMGADEAILIDAPETTDAFATAKALAKAISDEGGADQIFTGKQSIDQNNSSVTQMLASHLGAPHALVVGKYEAGDGKVTVEREVEGGTKEVIELTGTNVVGANKGLNKPRYASLPGIMKAKKKPVKELELSALGVTDTDIKITFSDFQLPPEKPPVKMIDGEPGAQSTELVKLLREEAKVI